jgi:hypothetical protein
MFGRDAASQIAAASLASFYKDFQLCQALL